MYKALDIAIYIISYSNKNKYDISYLKLIKLLYFVQVFYIVNYSRLLFIDDIKACNYGVTISAIHKEYFKYGSCNININKSYDNTIEPSDCLLINQIIIYFKDYTSTDLLKIIHNQKPWKEAFYGDIKIITKESIIKYFK